MNAEITTDIEQPYPCGYCGMRFTSYTDLRAHTDTACERKAERKQATTTATVATRPAASMPVVKPAASFAAKVRDFLREQKADGVTITPGPRNQSSASHPRAHDYGRRI